MTVIDVHRATRALERVVALGVAALFFSALLGWGAVRAEAQEEPMSKEIEIVASFIAAFNDKDVDRIMSFFAPGAIYHNMPTDPVEGRDAVRGVIESYVSAATEIDWEVLGSAQTGSTVFNERVDRFVFGDKKVALPVMGAFEIRDGKIAVWRDYFDQATWTRQMED